VGRLAFRSRTCVDRPQYEQQENGAHCTWRRICEKPKSAHSPSIDEKRDSCTSRNSGLASLGRLRTAGFTGQVGLVGAKSQARLACRAVSDINAYLQT